MTVDLLLSAGIIAGFAIPAALVVAEAVHIWRDPDGS